MPKLTVKNLLDSDLVVGNPEHVSTTVPPKGTKVLDVTKDQLKGIQEQLDKLKASQWADWSLDAAPAPAPAPKAAPAEEKPLPVETPVSSETSMVEEAKAEETKEPEAAKPAFQERKNRHR